MQGNIGILRVGDKAIGLHAGEAPQAGSAEEVQQQRFRVVVGIVRHRHAFIAVFPAQLPEPMVAQLPGRHLHADSFGRCKCLRIKAFYMNGNPALPGPVRHKSFVSVALRTPEPEIAVGNGKRPAIQADLLSQAHGVDASADSHQQHLSACG